MEEIPAAAEEPLLQEPSLHSSANAVSGTRPQGEDTTKRNVNVNNNNNNKIGHIRTQLLGMLSSSRLLCLVMMLDLMTMSVQVCQVFEFSISVGSSHTRTQVNYMYSSTPPPATGPAPTVHVVQYRLGNGLVIGRSKETKKHAIIVCKTETEVKM